jgi:hypothetical protein
VQGRAPTEAGLRDDMRNSISTAIVAGAGDSGDVGRPLSFWPRPLGPPIGLAFDAALLARWQGRVPGSSAR